MKGINKKPIKHPNRLIEYWKREWLVLGAIVISGITYNVGMLAGPIFQGKMIDALVGRAELKELVKLGSAYISAILGIQIFRAVKRFYVRRFANNTSRAMRITLYNSLVHKTKRQLQDEQLGSLMTKVISDVDACVEGMRKFTTEIFDTGVLLISYLAAMAVYDVKLTLLASIFIPVAMMIAQQLKKLIYKYTSSYRRAMGSLSETTYDLIDNSLLYRIYGREEDNKAAYHRQLEDIEKKAILANVWENAMQPVYKVVAMLGIVLVIIGGGHNVAAGIWSIGTFSTYMSLFISLASKASRAAKLFNSIQKAAVSWKRIRPYMEPYQSNSKEMFINETSLARDEAAVARQDNSRSDDKKMQSTKLKLSDEAYGENHLSIKQLSFRYDSSPYIIKGLNLEVSAGEMIGVTGMVACGKSTLGRLFIEDRAYEGDISLNSVELRNYSAYGRSHMVSYLGHQPQLLSDTIYHNITLGDEGNVDEVIDLVCFKEDLKDMEKGIHTLVGNGGVRLSGGQQARIALARALYHKAPLIILDDPFSAVDRKTEDKIIEKLRAYQGESIILLLSHRLAAFSQLNQILLMREDGAYELGTHQKLMESCEIYRMLYNLQEGKEG